MTQTPQMTVSLDTVEPRVTQDATAVLSDGRYWDVVNSTAYIDPITRTALLMPLCKTPAWTTDVCGRLSLTDVQVHGGDPTQWVQYTRGWASERWLKCLHQSDGVTTKATYPKNQPWYLGWFGFGTGADEYVAMECGWSDGSLPYNPTTASNPDIRLRFWSNGKTEIYKNGVFVGEGNVFERKVTSQNAYGTETTSSKADGKQLAGQTVEVMLIPYRRRELLIVSNTGGGFRFVFEDIDVNDPNPTITGAGTFFVYQAGQPNFQMAPLQTQTGGYALSLPNAFLVPPASGAGAQTLAYWDAPGYGATSVMASLVDQNNGGAFLPNNTNRYCRLRADLTSDGNATPACYGATAVFPSVVANTDGTHKTVLDPWLERLTLSVPESPTDVSLHLDCNSPQAIETAGASLVRVLGNRPVEAKMGTVAFLTGRTKAPQWMQGINDRAQDLMLDARDRCGAMESHRISSPVPVDGTNLSSALGYFVTQPGYSTSDLDIQAIDYTLPTSGQTSEGEYALLPEPNDTSLQWVQRLWETFARNYSWGWVPRLNGPTFRFYDLPTLNAQTPAVTLYGTISEALAAGVTRAKIPGNVYRSYRETTLLPEANEIWVMGRNAKTGKPLRTHYIDRASADPTLAPSTRPDNWLGETWRFAYSDPALTTLPDGARTCEQLARRLTCRRVLGEFVSDFLLFANGQPVWRNDVVRLAGMGTYRILSLNGDMKNDYANKGGSDPYPDMIWRPFTYCTERITTETPFGTI